MSKIMLVEDDNNLREIYEARLQAEGYQIVAAKDGEEALVVAKGEKPDLIISDIMMPKISGFEMLDILRNTDGLKDVKVIMLTALGQNDDQEKADRLGADRYLVKSQVTLEDIVKVTHELLGDAEEPAPAAAPTPAVADASVTPAPVAATPPPAAPAPDPTPTTPAAPAPPVVAVAEPAPAAAPTPAVADASVTPDPTPPPQPAPVAPLPEPVAPEPPAAPPVTIDTTAADSTASGAQSTDQEEATVESQVENFVAGATEQPAPPAEAVDTEPPATAPTIQPPANAVNSPGTEINPTDPVTAQADDKLVKDAADALAGDDDKTAQAADPAQSPSDSRTKRIIHPIDGKPKKDINALLAVEEAKAQSQPVTPAPVIVTDDPKAQPGEVPPNPVIAPPPEAAEEPAIIPAAQTPLPQAEKPVDPSSIAL